MKEEGHLKRGNLLWESSRMFLPEHREQLLEHRRQRREFEPPELEEDRLAELDGALHEALSTGSAVLLTYAGRYGPEQLLGRVTRIDPLKALLRVETSDQTLQLPFAKLLHLERARTT